MFRVKPDQVKIIFIVNPTKKDSFLEFIYTLGFQWFRYNWNELVESFEEIDCIVVESDDPRVDKIIDKLNDPMFSGVFYWLIGCDSLVKSINPFAHYIHNRKEEWKTFNQWFEQKHGTTFGKILKDHMK